MANMIEANLESPGIAIRQNNQLMITTIVSRYICVRPHEYRTSLGKNQERATGVYILRYHSFVALVTASRSFTKTAKSSSDVVTSKNAPQYLSCRWSLSGESKNLPVNTHENCFCVLRKKTQESCAHELVPCATFEKPPFRRVILSS